MTKEKEALLSWKFLVGIASTLTAAAFMTIAQTGIQIRDDWRKMTDTIPSIMQALESKTSDRWTATDHKNYADGVSGTLKDHESRLRDVERRERR